MGKNNNEGVTSLFIGALAGLSLGWMFKNYIAKRQQLEENKPIWESLKNVERKVYEDGRKRADEIDQIKKDVHSKITQ